MSGNTPAAKPQPTPNPAELADTASIREQIADLTARLSKLDAHAAVIAEERARVSGELAKLLSKASLAPPERQTSTKADIARQRELRGKCAAMCLEDIEHIARVWCSAVSCIALGDGCALVLFDDGREPVFSDALASQCPQLHEQLTSRAAGMPPPIDAAIGSEDRFYLRFADGKQEWIASDECTADIKTKPVARVSFGSDWGEYCIIYKDGSCKYADVPSQLEAKLRTPRPKKAPIAAVNLGPEGEWFISFADGTWEMGGCSDSLHDKVDSIVKSGAQIRLIVFGANDAWVVRHTKPPNHQPRQQT